MTECICYVCHQCGKSVEFYTRILMSALVALEERYLTTLRSENGTEEAKQNSKSNVRNWLAAVVNSNK